MQPSPMRRPRQIPRAQEFIRVSLIAIVPFILMFSGCGQRCNESSDHDPICQRVGNYEAGGHNFALAMGTALQKYGVPNGFELDSEPGDRAISVRVLGGTVADVLDAIIAQVPDYKWVETNRVVNVMPKHNTNSILDLQIAHFYVRDAAPGPLRLAVASLPEVHSWLTENHVTERSALGILGPIVQPPFVSLGLNNLTLREIMNRIVKEHRFSSWSFGRYGERNQYLSISIE
jgi:hypothetical protein